MNFNFTALSQQWYIFLRSLPWLPSGAASETAGEIAWSSEDGSCWKRVWQPVYQWSTPRPANCASASTGSWWKWTTRILGSYWCTGCDSLDIQEPRYVLPVYRKTIFYVNFISIAAVLIFKLKFEGCINNYSSLSDPNGKRTHSRPTSLNSFYFMHER